MSILRRFTDIMSSNVNAMLDKLENPEKMVDQYLRRAEKDLAEVTSETASVMATEKKALRRLENCKKEIAELTKFAEDAILAGNEADAVEFLTKKKEYEENLAELDSLYVAAKENSEKMRQLHSKLESDYQTLKIKSDTLKSKAKVAKTRQNLNKYTSTRAGKASNTISAFEKLEDKINTMMDTAEATVELEEMCQKDNVTTLKEKYSTDAKKAAVMEELDAMKKRLAV